MRDNLENELRQKYPAVGRKADYENSRTSAIKLFCLACQGGSRPAVEECDCYDCPLWPFRPYKDARERPPESIPSLDWYQSKAQEAADALEERGGAFSGGSEE